MAIPSRYANPARIVSNARTFFITSSIQGKRSLLQSDRSAKLFIEVLYEYRTQSGYLLHEFVVMPDHFHLLLTVAELSVERAVQLVKGGFAFRAGKMFGFKAPVWQKGFSEIRVLDEGAYANQRRYIHNNPVERHLVERAEEYPYSSAHAGFELDPPPQGLKPPS